MHLKVSSGNWGPFCIHPNVLNHYQPSVYGQAKHLTMTLLLRRLVSWINHLPPACWSTFWKSNFKQQLGCRFDIIDIESYFFVS